MFMPQVMDLTEHPRIHPLTSMSNGAGLFNLLCICPHDAHDVVTRIKFLHTADPVSSFCVVVPMTRALDSNAFKGWTVLTEWSKNHYFHAPGFGDTLRRCRNRVRAYYLPPNSDMECNAISLNGVKMTFAGMVNGQRARVLMDTGASHSYLGLSFARSLGLKTESDGGLVELGDSKATVETHGNHRVTVRMDSCTTRWRCLLLDLNTKYDLILGDDWLTHHRVQTNHGDGSAVVFKGNKSHTLRGIRSKEPLTTKLLSAMQLKRKLRTGSQCFLVLLNKVEEDESVLEFPVEMQPLVKEFADVFAAPPSGLPPARNVGHTIPLEPGAVPPFRPLYRLSPLEQAEAKRQIEEYLAKGWIEPSSSPYGAPILFVPKKNGQLRMCVDYRALNKVTVKNRFPLPRIEDLFDKLRHAKVFTSLDLAQGYHQIRITDADVPKTAFRTPYGHYQWRVLSFGLTNAPATFQRLMNDIFRAHLDKFVLVYLDDILIFSNSMEEHLQHLRTVLRLLRHNKLYAQPAKCQFMQDEVAYLGHIVGRGGLRVDPKKVAAVQEWTVPQDVGQLRSFLGLTNYFRKFLENYSTVVAPLTRMTGKNVQWKWTKECQQAFVRVRNMLVHAPVLVLPDFNKPFTVVTDASDLGLGAVLLQEDHPVAFESRKLSSAEQAYHTSEKEMLAVVHALRTWRCYLEGVTFKVITDHNPNTYFHTQQHLSRRQTRWSELISSFTFDFQYRPGKTNVADSLSRQPVGPAPLPESETLMVMTRGRIALSSLIKQGYRRDPWFKQGKNQKALRQADGFWYRGEALVVPEYKDIRKDILYEMHCSKYAGHFGLRKTRLAVQEKYWWPGWASDVHEYVKRCDACARNKSKADKPGGLLQPLPIPNAPWEDVSMDFITRLPETMRGHDAILVFCDRLTKMVHFAATTTDVGAEETARLFTEHVFRLHGQPKYLVSDRDARFTSKFWTELMKRLGTKQRLSSAFHPQTDGQTERVNRTLEQMLRMFVGPKQDDWDELLPALEFACNNAVHDSTGNTPFYLNQGWHPTTPLDREVGRFQVPSAQDFTEKQQHALADAKALLRKAQERQKSYADSKRREIEFVVGDKVLLSTKNLRLNQPGVKKLMPRYVGPFEVIERVGKVAYRLSLPASLPIHDVFHVSLLANYEAEGPYQPPPIILPDGTLEYEVERILDHRPRQYGRGKRRHEYLIKWTGYEPGHNSWEPEENIPESLKADYWRTQARLVQERQARGVVKAQRTAQLRGRLPRSSGNITV